MTDANNAKGFAAQVDMRTLRPRAQRRGHILRHRRSITAGSVRPCDTLVATKIGIDVVETDSGRSHEPDRRCSQQRSIAARARTHYQRIGSGHGIRREIDRRQIVHISHRLEHTPDERDTIVNKNTQFRFHLFWKRKSNRPRTSIS